MIKIPDYEQTYTVYTKYDFTNVAIFDRIAGLTFLALYNPKRKERPNIIQKLDNVNMLSVGIDDLRSTTSYSVASLDAFRQIHFSYMMDEPKFNLNILESGISVLETNTSMTNSILNDYKPQVHLMRFMANFILKDELVPLIPFLEGDRARRKDVRNLIKYTFYIYYLKEFYRLNETIPFTPKQIDRNMDALNIEIPKLDNTLSPKDIFNKGMDSLYGSK